jgi:hypothetical protein
LSPDGHRQTDAAGGAGDDDRIVFGNHSRFSRAAFADAADPLRQSSSG